MHERKKSKNIFIIITGMHAVIIYFALCLRRVKRLISNKVFTLVMLFIITLGVYSVIIRITIELKDAIKT